MTAVIAGKGHALPATRLHCLLPRQLAYWSWRGLLLWGGLAVAAVAAAQQPPRWQLEQNGDGALVWRGELPAAPPRSVVEWRASAVWTSAWDRETTHLLADSGLVLSRYYPNHLVPLGTLGSPPGSGWVHLVLESPAGWRVEAVARVSSPRTEWDDVLAAADAGRRDLEAELAVARRYGVRAPEAEALLAIGEWTVAQAHGLQRPSTRRSEGRWWLEWFAAGAAKERRWLESIRHDQGAWTVLPDPPVVDGLELRGGQIVARVWSPTDPVWVPVRLAGVTGQFRPGDAGFLRRLGFNLYDGAAEVGFAEEARRMNIISSDSLPGGVQVVRWQAGMADPALASVVLLDGWEPYEEGREQTLADKPWRLHAAAVWTIRWRAGLPMCDQSPAPWLGLPEIPVGGGPPAPPWEAMAR